MRVEKEPATNDVPPGKTPAIYAAICAAMNAIGAVGKTEKNKQQGFAFRGIDQILNEVGPVMRDHCLFMAPTIVDISRTPITTEAGGGAMNTVVTVRYRCTSGLDGSYVDITVPGEAMDTGDKSTAKAMSVALRTAMITLFAICTGDRDPDQDIYERAPAKANAAPDPWCDTDPNTMQELNDLVDQATTAEALRLVWSAAQEAQQAGRLSSEDAYTVQHRAQFRAAML